VRIDQIGHLTEDNPLVGISSTKERLSQSSHEFNARLTVASFAHLFVKLALELIA